MHRSSSLWVQRTRWWIPTYYWNTVWNIPYCKITKLEVVIIYIWKRILYVFAPFHRYRDIKSNWCLVVVGNQSWGTKKSVRRFCGCYWQCKYEYHVDMYSMSPSAVCCASWARWAWWAWWWFLSRCSWHMHAGTSHALYEIVWSDHGILCHVQYIVVVE